LEQALDVDLRFCQRIVGGGVRHLCLLCADGSEECLSCPDVGIHRA
jgi:hypothetical protein